MRSETAPLKYLPIAGTHGWRGEQKGEWWLDSSPFAVYMLTLGCVHLAAGRRPFIWSTDLNGHHLLGRLFGLRQFHSDWEAGGHSLYWYLRPFNDTGDTYVPIADRNLIAHSHALQVVLYACAYGLRINTLVSVMSPVRRDMLPIAERARPNIGRWLHLHSDDDGVQIAGTVGDGWLGKVRQHPLADNRYIPKVGHSRILNDVDAMRLWDTAGLVTWLKETA